jgi:predicted small integral membrane protein
LSDRKGRRKSWDGWHGHGDGDLLRRDRVPAAHLHEFLPSRYPETPRVGVLRIETTRGDRLFITLLGSAFINLAWLGLEVGPQPYALLVCLAYAVAVFRWV